MKWSFLLVLLLNVNATVVLSQTHNDATTSPKALVEEYWKFETHGERVSPGGWKSAERFLLRVAPIPAARRITVVTDKYSVWDPWVNGKTARVNVGVARIWGDVNEDLTFTKHSTRAIKEGVLFKLSLVDKHWETSPDGRTTEIPGPMEWRIDEPSERVWLNVEAAIGYVQESSKQNNDASIKTNAERTVAKLKAMR